MEEEEKWIILKEIFNVTSQEKFSLPPTYSANVVNI